MRFVLGTPTQPSIFGADHDGDDAVASMATCPVRRGSSWLIAMVTQRMRFLVFSSERSSPWSRRVIGQLPVAAGAVTEGPSSSSGSASASASTHLNDGGKNIIMNNKLATAAGSSSSNSSSFAGPSSSINKNINNDEVLRIVETPIAI